MRIAFVVADARGLRPGGGTAHLLRAAAARGHEVGLVGAFDLTLTADNGVVAQVLRPGAAEPVESALTEWDVVFLRYHPERESMPGPAIDFGWRLKLGGVLVVNDPEGMQRAGARMYLSGLPAEIRPRTLISRDPARLKAFLRAHAPAVVKPLADRDELFVVRRGQWKNLNQIIEVVRASGYVVAQEYLPAVKEGEKRLVLCGGEPVRAGKRVAIYRRIVGEDGEVERRPCELEPSDQRIIDLLRPKLLADGLYLVAADVVGDKVLEVNVFTPGGFQANLDLHGLDVADAVMRDLERRVEVRRAYRRAVS